MKHLGPKAALVAEPLLLSQGMDSHHYYYRPEEGYRYPFISLEN
jgi:hypothetical protein